MADPAGLQIPAPLALGLNLYADHVLASGAGSCPITFTQATLSVIAGGAALGITSPLALGLGLVGDLALVSSQFSVPLTMRDATLALAGGGADVGATSPLALGLVLFTAGSSAFVIASVAFSAPVSMAPGILALAAEPADVQITAPLSLGLLLSSSDYLLRSGAMNVPIALADAEPSEFLRDDPTEGRGISGRARAMRQPRFEAQFEPMVEMPLMPRPIDLREVELILGALFEIGVFDGA